jgi:hypothetical protein
MNKASVCLLLAAGSAMAQGIITPAREVDPITWTAIKGSLTELATSSFSTAAMVEASHNAVKVGPMVKRSATAMTSAQYAGVSEKPAPMPLPVPAENAEATGLFKMEYGDSGQAWSTMTGNGRTYAFAQVFGKGTAMATNSWTAKVWPPSVRGGSGRVYAEFSLPEIKLGGFFEQVAPGATQTRARAELLVNQHVIWQMELVDRGQYADSGSTDFTTNRLLSRFGSASTVTENLEVFTAAARTYRVDLGTFPSDKELEVVLVVRLDAQGAGTCVERQDEANPGVLKFFCTRATAAIKWDAAMMNPVRFYR